MTAFWKDLLAMAAALQAAVGNPRKPFACYARGPNAALVLVHALPELNRSERTAFQGYVLREGFLNYRQFLERPLALERSYALFAEKGKETTAEKEIPFHFIPHRALARFDLMDMLDAVKASGVVVDPFDGDWQPTTISRSRDRTPRNVRVLSWRECESEPGCIIPVPR